MSSTHTKQKHPPDKSVYLPASGTWSKSWYLLEGRIQDALALAVACGRPLLVRGLPGTGKSDLARAAAIHLQRAFVYEVVTVRTEPQDLLWRFDAIARLADAQAQKANESLDYVSPGMLWWAINWESAAEQIKGKPTGFALCPDKELDVIDGSIKNQQQRAQKQGCVLLLDEIDKADSDLPNSLLEVLANTSFRLPWGDGEIKKKDDDVAKKPLIIITTNEDRELPAAFVRRCLVLTIKPDSDFKTWLINRARVHYSSGESVDNIRDERPVMDETVLESAVDKLISDRTNPGNDNHKPGLAEYLDLLRGLYHLTENYPDTEKKAQQLNWLERVSCFAYDKHSLPEY